MDHVEKVMQTAASNSAAARSRLAASWRRSVVKHGLDPSERGAAHIIDAPTLGRRQRKHARFMTVAAPRLDRLYSLLGASGCAVFLTDTDGVILDQRLADGDRPAFESWGLRPGADWSEAREGTNGIGTCLAENRSLIIHRDEHFYARNIAMSCIDAPIYGPDGQLVAALDVSSARADQTEGFNRLIAAQVTQTARAIEEAHFRATYACERIVMGDAGDSDAAVLLAIDDDDLVVGATREARRLFDLGADAFAPRPAADLLGHEEDAKGFEKAERTVVVRALARTGGNVSEAARSLGVGRATLYRRMKRLGLT
ncbi:GAF domain-containing protein [Maritimibacter sp. DP1N21-5]|nr:GAF domain-containing protein [Maritimibacter sp. DP1N21-5]